MARRTVVEVSSDLDRLITECEVVETKIYTLELKLALLEQKTAGIEKDLSKVFGAGNWASKVFFGAIIVAATGAILAGGLS